MLVLVSECRPCHRAVLDKPYKKCVWVFGFAAYSDCVTMMPNPRGDTFYRRILAVSARDAWLFLWSYRVTMVSFFATGYVFLFAVLWPLVGLLRGKWAGIGSYLAGMIFWPLPFLLVMMVARHVNLRIGRRYEYLNK